MISPYLLWEFGLAWSYVGNRSCCEFLSVMTVLCLENSLPQPPALTLFPFFFHDTPSRCPVNDPTGMHIQAVLIVPGWLIKEGG